MPQPMERFWLPPAYFDRQITTLNRVLREYDERLMFVRNEDNGDWVVALKQERPNPPLPVLGFQDQIPTPDELLARVRAADTKRHTDWLEENINKHNEQAMAPVREKADEAEWQLVEGMESFLHAQDKTPYKRIFNKAVESRRTGGK